MASQQEKDEILRRAAAEVKEDAEETAEETTEETTEELKTEETTEETTEQEEPTDNAERSRLGRKLKEEQLARMQMEAKLAELEEKLTPEDDRDPTDLLSISEAKALFSQMKSDDEKLVEQRRKEYQLDFVQTVLSFEEDIGTETHNAVIDLIDNDERFNKKYSHNSTKDAMKNYTRALKHIMGNGKKLPLRQEASPAKVIVEQENETRKTKMPKLDEHTKKLTKGWSDERILRVLG